MKQEVTVIPFTYHCHHRNDRKYKYLGGVLGPDDCIYCIPSDADFVLKVDPATQTAYEVGESLEGRTGRLNCNKWQNGFLAADGRIYGIPLKSASVLCIDVATQTVYTVGSGFTGANKWEGGVLAHDGAMYCIPMRHKHILKINPETPDGKITVIVDEHGHVLEPTPITTPMASMTGGAVHKAGTTDGHVSVAAAASNGSDGAEPARPHDALFAHLSTAKALACATVNGHKVFGRHVAEALAKDGYIVLPGVLSTSECADELSRMWEYVERVSPGVLRDEPASWYPAGYKYPGTKGGHKAGEEAAAPDPWPHSGWRSFCDMMQTHQAGWVFTELREKLATRVFEPLYGTRELHASKEGFTFHRPTATGEGRGIHPGVDKQAFVCGQPSHTSGEHFDQGHSESGLQYIQSSTSLLDQQSEDACFLCWPGSHRCHQQLTKSTHRGRSHWVPLTDAELDELRAAGLEPRRVPVKAGDVILWRSDLAHSAAPPLGPRPNFRAVSYTCMLPAALTPAHVLAKKVEAYRHGHTGDHAPSREYWHTSKLDEATESTRRPWYVDGKPPRLTPRQAELFGIVPYGHTATPT